MASRQKLVDMCDPWINFLSENTSLHGVSWYPKTENRFIKSLICLFTALVIFGLPWILIVQMIEFQRDVSILNSVDYVKNVNLSYPNLTICHPSYFDMDKLKGKGDPIICYVYHFFEKRSPSRSLEWRFVLNEVND